MLEDASTRLYILENGNKQMTFKVLKVKTSSKYPTSYLRKALLRSVEEFKVNQPLNKF